MSNLKLSALTFPFWKKSIKPPNDMASIQMLTNSQ